MKVALATSDGVSVNAHFGGTPFFVIAEVDANGYTLLERRVNPNAREQTDKEHNKTRFEETARLVSDCGAVIAARIGRSAVNELHQRDIQALEQAGTIEVLLSRYVNYLSKGAFKARPNGAKDE